MKITIDTSSIEALNATSEQIKNEISRIENESKSAREKGTAKTTQVQKTAKVKKDILVDEVEFYEALLHASRSVAGFKAALTKKQKREAAEKEAAMDEQIFDEALAAENDMVAKSQELEEERKEIHEAFDEVQRLESELETKQARLDASRERIPGVFQASEVANRAQEESQRAILQDNSEPSLIESFKVDQEQAEKAGALAGERREIHEAYVDVEETKEDLQEARARLEESRRKIAEKFAAVERAKAEAERTAAKLDARFAPIHEAEAKSHDAKSEFFDLHAGKPINKEEQDKAVLRSNLADVIQARIDQLNKEEAERTAKEAESKAISVVPETSAITPAEIKPIINDMPDFNSTKADGAYGLRKNQIVQDLPIQSKDNQTFNTPGMTPEQIKESQEKLAKVPMREGNATPTVSWVEMKERINSLMLKKEMDDKNLNPDDIYALYYLRTHPEAAPSPDFIKDLLIWAGIAPLERVTPRTTGPAPIQEQPVKKGAEEIPTPQKDMTDKEIEAAEAEISRGKGTITTRPGDMTDEEIEATEAEIMGRGPKTTTTPTEDKKTSGISDADVKGFEDILDKAVNTTKKPKTEEVKPKETPKKEKSKGKKVKKHEPFKTRMNKKFLMLKGLLYGENLKNKPQSYVDIVLAMAKLRGSYKKNSAAANADAIKNIDGSIKSAKDLTTEQCRHLYSKLVKLSKKTQIVANAAKDIDEPTEAMTPEEQAEFNEIFDSISRSR